MIALCLSPPVVCSASSYSDILKHARTFLFGNPLPITAKTVSWAQVSASIFMGSGRGTSKTTVSVVGLVLVAPAMPTQACISNVRNAALLVLNFTLGHNQS